MNRFLPWLVGSALLLPLAVQAQNLPDFSALIERYGSAVVNVRGVAARESDHNDRAVPEGIPEPFRRFFEDGPQRRRGNPRSHGSGFVISPDGLILTNAHVVDGAERITVSFNDRTEVEAELIGMDERTDVAVLDIDAEGLDAVRLGDSDRVRVGEWVLAIGSPFGFERSATQGIVSALSRSLPDGTYVPFIQTDAAVNPGNSGGPLFNLEGEVIGINSQIYSRSGGYQGLSFAIPINLAIQVADQLRDQGFVERGWLGVMIQDLDQDLADSFGLDRPRGALVSQVLAGSPAADAGIETGDVILSFDGVELARSSALPPVVGATPVGAAVDVVVLREGRERTLSVEIGALDEEQSQRSATPPEPRGGRLGLRLRELDAEALAALELDYGVGVAAVQGDSPAEEAGIREGDVVLEFDGQRIERATDLVEAVENAPAGQALRVLLRRGDANLFVTVTLPPARG